MLTRISLGIIIWLAFLAGVCLADTITPRDSVKTYVNIRSTPDTTLEPIGSLQKGESLEYVGEVPYWYKVKLEGHNEAFVYKAFTRKIASLIEVFADLKSEARTATCNSTGAPDAPGKYSASKVGKPLMWVHRGHMFEIYCGCPYDDDKDIDIAACGYEPHSTAKNAKRIEWEHVVPASHFGNYRPCWVNQGGKSGRDNCRGQDEDFRLMEADLYNLQPSIGRLNGLRSNNHYGEVDQDPEFGDCEFRIGHEEDGPTLVEPPDEVKGDLARAMFYMAEHYGAETIRLTPNEAEMLKDWAEGDPIDDWELERSCRISHIQGHKNPYVQAE